MTTGIHISQRFAQKLAELNHSVLAIAQRITLRYGVATTPLHSGNPATTASASATIWASCMMENPQIVATMAIVRSIERIGDYAKILRICSVTCA
jgi:hypothetical protein